MAAGTKFRLLARLLDASDAPVWAIDAGGKIIYLSAGVSLWLGVEAERLLDRHSVAGSPVSDDPMDLIAASLSPPQGLRERGTASLRVQPPSLGPHPIDTMDVRFIRLGGTEGVTIAVGGDYHDRIDDPELHDAVAVRQRLDAWRRSHQRLAAIATAGVSAAARRLRVRLQVAASTRTHVGFFGPPGSGAESMAARVHQASAPGESIVHVDGPLMDAELLDAVMVPLINRLADRDDACGTALVRGLDEMPLEAQQRLAGWLAEYGPSDRGSAEESGSVSGPRLRLLALCGARPHELADPLDDPAAQEDDGWQDEPRRGIDRKLIEVLGTLSAVIEPLSRRVEDIPMLAAAALDARHAAGEGSAERFNRAALDAMVLYPWPGNFEELDDAVRYAIKVARRPAVGPEHLPLAVRSFRAGGETEAVRTIPSLDDAVRRYERQLIDEAVETCDGNRAEAARRLGISRARLIRRLDEGRSQ